MSVIFLLFTSKIYNINMIPLHAAGVTMQNDICTEFWESMLFTVFINYRCFAEVYRILKLPSCSQPSPPNSRADVFIFFPLILYFLLGLLSRYFVSECGRQNNCLYISWIDFLHSSNTVVRPALRHPWQAPVPKGFVIQDQKKHLEVKT